MTQPQDHCTNRLLAAFPGDVLARWRPLLEPVELPLGTELKASGLASSHVYFPTTAIICRLYVTREGASSEVSMVGNEGLVGITSFMGGGTPVSRAEVQYAGRAFRVPASVVKAEFDRSHEVARLLLRYAQALMTQVAQTVVCNRHHSLDQRLCRSLLMALDRLPGNELTMTQERMARLLGVRREGVTAAATALHQAGVLRYARGHVTVNDRAALEARTCECYRVVRNEYRRLLPDAAPQPEDRADVVAFQRWGGAAAPASPRGTKTTRNPPPDRSAASSARTWTARPS